MDEGLFPVEVGRFAEGAMVRRVGDLELLENDTTHTTYRVTPSEGALYVEKSIWEWRDPAHK